MVMKKRNTDFDDHGGLYIILMGSRAYCACPLTPVDSSLSKKGDNSQLEGIWYTEDLCKGRRQKNVEHHPLENHPEPVRPL